MARVGVQTGLPMASEVTSHGELWAFLEILEVLDPSMSWLFHLLLFGSVTRWNPQASARERDLLLEIMILRHQLSVLQRKHPKPRLSPSDRWLWAWISRRWQGWKLACILVKPETVIGWHRQGFRLFWRWKSRRKPGGKRTGADVVALIRRMSRENPTWGSPRIHGELAKLGFRISERTVLRYMPKRKGTEKQRQAWRTFLDNHREAISAMYFLVVPTLNFRQIYILVILHHGRRIIAHVNVTTNPTAEWSGRPGWLPTSAPHRSEHAQLRHSALRITDSLRFVSAPSGQSPAAGAESAPASGSSFPTLSRLSGIGGSTTFSRYVWRAT